MKKSLNKKFIIIFLSVLFVVFLLLLSTVAITANVSTRHYVENDLQQSVTSVNAELTDTLNEINYFYTRVLQSSQLEKIALGQDDDSLDAEYLKMLEECSASAGYLNVVMIIGERTFCSAEQYDLPDKSFLLRIEKATNILCCGDIGKGDYVQIGRRLQSSRLGVEGYVVFYLSCQVLNENCRVIDDSLGSVCIMNGENTVVANSNGQNLGKTFVDYNPVQMASAGVWDVTLGGSRQFVMCEKLSNQYNLDWYVVCSLSRKTVQKDFVTLMWILTGIALLCFVIATIISLKVSKKVASPINNLSQKISSVDFERRKGLITIGTDGDELYELERRYAEMIERLFLLIDKNEQNMEIQRKLEIDALQMQINPHFLYNTLDAIAWMAKIKKQPEIETLVINLARFFRLSLHKGAKYVTIAEETAIVEHFLEIQKIRFPDAINYVCNLPEGIGEYKTLKLILQPIVENCIKHGFAGKEGIGSITISAMEDGDDIVLSVVDDGWGFVVTDDFWSKKSEHPNGYGLANVNERIKLEYGPSYGLEIKSAVGKGTTVTARIKKSL